MLQRKPLPPQLLPLLLLPTTAALADGCWSCCSCMPLLLISAASFDGCCSCRGLLLLTWGCLSCPQLLLLPATDVPAAAAAPVPAAAPASGCCSWRRQLFLTSPVAAMTAVAPPAAEPLAAGHLLLSSQACLLLLARSRYIINDNHRSVQASAIARKHFRKTPANQRWCWHLSENCKSKELYTVQCCATVACFFTEQREWPCMPRLLWSARNIQKGERTQRRIALWKKARCHVSSEKLKKNGEDLKNFKHPGWQPVSPKPWPLFRFCQSSRPALPSVLPKPLQLLR